MRGDEGELKAAGEEAEHQQHVGAVTEGFGQRLPEDCGAAARSLPACRRPRRKRERERHNEQHEHAQTPVSAGCQPKLSISATPNGANTNCPNEPAAVPAPKAMRAPFLRQQLAEGRQHQIERTAGQTEADQNAGADIERHGVVGIAHHQQAERHRSTRRCKSRARCRTCRRSRRRRAGRCPTADFERQRRVRRHRGPSENSRLMGCMKKPKVERGPNVSMPIRQPQMMITSGVRQPIPTPNNAHMYGQPSGIPFAACRTIPVAASRQPRRRQ